MGKKFAIFLILMPLLTFSQDFTIDDNGLPCARNAYTFTPQISGTFDQIVWDYGDNTSETVLSDSPVNHSYINAGIYTITMTVYSNNTQVAQVQHTITVYDKPNLTMTYEAPSLVCAPNDKVWLTVDSVNIEAPDLKFTIDWGDGTTENYTMFL
jgi:hypothetical protein